MRRRSIFVPLGVKSPLASTGSVGTLAQNSTETQAHGARRVSSGTSLCNTYEPITRSRFSGVQGRRRLPCTPLV